MTCTTVTTAGIRKDSSTPAANPAHRMPFGNSGTPELSPAALTLKQMAEQHQHKAQMGMAGSMAPSMNPTGPTQAPQVQTANPAAMRMPMRNFPADYPAANPGSNVPGNGAGGGGSGHFIQRPPYQGYGPNSPMIKKEAYFVGSPLGGSPGAGRQQQQPVPGIPQQQLGVASVAKSSPVPISQSSPMNNPARRPPTPQQIQQQQIQQQQFNARKVPTPTNSGRTPPPSTTSVQFSQTQQQQMQMNMNNNGHQIQVTIRPSYFMPLVSQPYPFQINVGCVRLSIDLSWLSSNQDFLSIKW